MPEITLGSGGGGQSDSGGSSGGGGLDISSMLDQLEEAQEKLMENPQLAKMLGIDLDDFQESMTDANEAVEAEGKELNSDFLIDLLEGLQSVGYGDTTVNELAEFVDNNPEQVDEMIDTYV